MTGIKVGQFGSFALFLISLISPEVKLKPKIKYVNPH